MTTLQPTILIVDDDPDILASVCDILEDRGFVVDVASSGETALRLVETRRYDVALLDFKMPDMDGAELYRRIRQKQSITVAIMVTAYAGSDGVQRARDAGTWRVMKKPVDMDQLITFIQSALSQRTVLVVDDDAEFCDSLWDTLREENYRVGLAHTADEAREEMQAGRYDVVLLDLLLGDENGVDLLGEMSHPMNARVVVVTGVNQDDDLVRQMKDRGIDGICYKPVDMANLLDILSN